MGRYLGYLRKATNFETGEPLFEIVKFEHGYGRYTGVAKKNEEEATKLMASLGDEKEVTLAQDAKIPEILAHLMKGHDVYIGGVPKKMSLSDDIEFVGRNLGDDDDPFHKKVDLDVNSPMYIKSKNPIVLHLLKMCESLTDINTHLDESYMFLSRIRWLLSTDVEEAVVAKELAKTAAKNPFTEGLPSLPKPKPRRRTGGRMTSKRATQRQKRI
jgi:hypothetical protein